MQSKQHQKLNIGILKYLTFLLFTTCAQKTYKKHLNNKQTNGTSKPVLQRMWTLK